MLDVHANIEALYARLGELERRFELAGRPLEWAVEETETKVRRLEEANATIAKDVGVLDENLDEVKSKMDQLDSAVDRFLSPFDRSSDDE